MKTENIVNACNNYVSKLSDLLSMFKFLVTVNIPSDCFHADCVMTCL